MDSECCQNFTWRENYKSMSRVLILQSKVEKMIELRKSNFKVNSLLAKESSPHCLFMHAALKSPGDDSSLNREKRIVGVQ